MVLSTAKINMFDVIGSYGCHQSPLTERTLVLSLIDSSKGIEGQCFMDNYDYD